MIETFRNFFFSLYEQQRLRNWFYTLAFAIFVPTGFRFAVLAWKYGDWFDKPLSILAGFLIGFTSVMTLLRIWAVPPTRTIGIEPAAKMVESATLHPNASQMYAAAKLQAARNREIARGAAALGEPHGWPIRR